MNKAVQNTLDLINEIDPVKGVYIMDTASKNLRPNLSAGDIQSNEDKLDAFNKKLLQSNNSKIIEEKIGDNDTKLSAYYLSDAGYYLVILSNGSISLEPSDQNKIEQFKVILNELLGKRIKIDSQLQDKYNKLKETAEKIDSILYSSDLKGENYYFITGAVEKIIGYTSEELINNKFTIIRHIFPEYIQDFKRFIREIKSGKESTLEYKIRDKNGKEHFIKHSGIPIEENGKIQRVVGIISDITDQKEVQENLRASEEKFRLLIETANDLIFNLDGFGYIILVNDSGAHNLGYSQKDMIGQHFLDFIDEESKEDTNFNFQKMLSSDEISSFDVEFTGKFGEKLIYEIQAKPIKKNNEITGLIGIGRDITQRRRDENKLKKLNTKLIETNRLLSVERDRAKHKVTVLEELNKLKNEFISNVSHELRTPLASIVGFAESIYSDPDMDRDTINEFNEIILNEGKRLANLINDILDFSRLESKEDKLDKTSFDFIKLLNNVTKSFENTAAEKGLEIKKEFPDNELIITADKERMYKVFENLLSNAMKFTNSGGSITVIAQEFSTEFEVIVSDTGVGIPEGELPKIFDKFSKINTKGSHQPGAGIGLSLVKQIVDLHKGIIRVRSEVDKGTSFIIRIPKK